MRRQGGISGAAPWMALWAAFSFATGATAQVIDIGPEGAVSEYAGPVTTIDGVRTPIALRAAPSRARLAARPRDRGALTQAIARASEHSQLSPELLKAVAWQESRFSQLAVSPKGARGVMQLTARTAKSLGVDPSNLAANVDGGSSYLAGLLREFDGDIMLALAAYDAGPAAVKRWRGIPPYGETRAYVAGVLDHLARSALGQTDRLEHP
jgi:soluble lytic murein transglycosylase-like protein